MIFFNLSEVISKENDQKFIKLLHDKLISTNTTATIEDQEIFSIINGFFPLNSTPRAKIKSIQALQGSGNIVFIFHQSNKGIIYKMTIEKLCVGLCNRNAMH